MKYALAQLNPVVGDIRGNTAKVLDAIARSARKGADLVLLPELCLVGYPPRDLLRKERFIRDNLSALDEVAKHCTTTAAVVGFVQPNPTGLGPPLQNAAALLADGKVQHVHVKRLLPTYDVFDESRYFQPGGEAKVIEFRGVRLGISICEELWDAAALGQRLYDYDPIAHLREQQPDVILGLAASPFQVGKARTRETLFARRAREVHAPLLYVNQVGGNDEIVFDGASCAFSAAGELLHRGSSFDEDLVLLDPDAPPPDTGAAALDDVDALRGAITLGLRDYVRKCGFHSVILGLSGGIDSALVAALAADALGPEHVTGYAMPSRYSSDHSVRDAEVLARNLGIHYRLVPIPPMHDAFESALRDALHGGAVDIAEENIQARIRGVTVMAASNAFGHLALATGNKSELSVGYCTLYGDMCGGLAPIGDVLKTAVYRLARRINEEAGYDRIPESTLTKPPSAELKPGQTDQDKLPPYDELDGILQRYVEEDWSSDRIIAEGYDPATVRRVINMVDSAEFKRKQAPPVLKVTGRSFGVGRRMPIAQRYREQERT